MSGVVSGFPGVTGWLPDEFDGRDHPFEPPSIKIKPTINLRTDPAYVKYWADPYDQLVIGSCVANAACAGYCFEAKKDAAAVGKYQPTVIEPSRGFVYYNARSAEFNEAMKKDPTLIVMSDSGCAPRNALKSLHQFGVCAESVYPYPCVDEWKQVRAKPTVQERKDALKEWKQRAGSKSTQYPGRQAYFGALFSRIAKYERLDNKRTDVELQKWRQPGHDKDKDADGEIVKQRLQLALSDGHPVVFGFCYYEEDQFQKVDKNTSLMKPLTTKHQQPKGDFGGHAVLAIGYDKDNVICQNSWGATWNKDGQFLMSWNWITDFEATGDFWIVKGFRDITNVDAEDLGKLKENL